MFLYSFLWEHISDLFQYITVCSSRRAERSEVYNLVAREALAQCVNRVWVLASLSSETQGQSVWLEKRRDESFQVQAEKPLGTDFHRTVSKRSSECWLLIGHKKCFALLCPIGEQHLLSSFREFVHDGYWLDDGLSSSCIKEMHAVRKL